MPPSRDVTGIISRGKSPGTLHIVGRLTSSGTIEIEVAGIGAGQFDVLDVSKPLDLHRGRVIFMFEDGYLPKL